MCRLSGSAMSSYETPAQKYGYLDIKQSSKVKGRKLKSWRRRWVVISQMNDLASDALVARVDIYDNDQKWRSNQHDRITFMLEHVTSINIVKSRTHPHAFEIVERHPVLVLSGATEMESYSWMLVLQGIFTPQQIECKKDTYTVTVQPDSDAIKWGLSGEYTLCVSPGCLSLSDANNTCVVSWGLSTLQRFKVESQAQPLLFDIECGPNSPTGQSFFRFASEEADNILEATRMSICMALAQKQNTRRLMMPRSRSTSTTISERSFQNLLDSVPALGENFRDRSESNSSSSTQNPGSPDVTSQGSPPFATSGSGTRRNKEPSISEMTALTEWEEHNIAHVALADSSVKNDQEAADICCRYRSKTSSAIREDPGYSVIKDTRRNTTTGSDHPELENLSETKVPLHPLRVVDESSTRARTISLREDGSENIDPDSAISSIASSSFNDDNNNNNTGQHLYEHLPSSGALNRRRSSSTPDLQAFWKTHKSESLFENVYEDLDELRHAVSGLNNSADSENPPALPERPFNMRFESIAQRNPTRQANKAKMSFFRRSTTYKAPELPGTSKYCSCADVTEKKFSVFSRGRQCITCNRTINSQGRKSETARTSLSKDDLAASVNSIMYDVYTSFSDITHLLAKRRRSSDITPVSSSSFLDDGSHSENPGTQAWTQQLHLTSNGLKTSPRLVHRSVNKQQREHFTDLIDLPMDLQRSTPSPTIEPVQCCQSSHPLISFFLDDEQFESHPMVTGKFPSDLELPKDQIETSPFEEPRSSKTTGSSALSPLSLPSTNGPNLKHDESEAIKANNVTLPGLSGLADTQHDLFTAFNTPIRTAQWPGTSQATGSDIESPYMSMSQRQNAQWANWHNLFSETLPLPDHVNEGEMAFADWPEFSVCDQVGGAEDVYVPHMGVCKNDK